LTCALRRCRTDLLVPSFPFACQYGYCRDCREDAEAPREPEDETVVEVELHPSSLPLCE
jgi:hypothetical protein